MGIRGLEGMESAMGISGGAGAVTAKRLEVILGERDGQLVVTVETGVSAGPDGARLHITRLSGSVADELVAAVVRILGIASEGQG